MTSFPESSEQVRPTRVEIDPEIIGDLRLRLSRTRWFPGVEGSGWEYGTDLEYLRDLCSSWEDDFDWFAVQDRLNAFDQVVTHVQGQRIHAIHQRSPEPNAVPLLLVHGWPGSVLEFLDVVGPLSDPAAHGRPGAPAFHVVCPSIPGYGFSGPTNGAGWNVRRISESFDTLMARLGYTSYQAAGGDWGAIIATDLARSERASHLTALHLTMPLGVPPRAGEVETLTADEQEGLDQWDRHLARGTVNHVQTNTHRPNTMSVAMNDSPAGLASWLVDMCRSFTVGEGDVEGALSRDQLLANITTYWVTGTIGSACRLYWEWSRQKASDPNPPFVTTPTSVAIFPNDVRRVPRAWAERLYNVVDWRVMPAGGHFGSWEQPELFVEALRDATA